MEGFCSLVFPFYPLAGLYLVTYMHILSANVLLVIAQIIPPFAFVCIAVL